MQTFAYGCEISHMLSQSRYVTPRSSLAFDIVSQNKEKSSYCRPETVGSCHLSSSIYYGGQSIYQLRFSLVNDGNRGRRSASTPASSPSKLSHESDGRCLKRIPLKMIGIRPTGFERSEFNSWTGVHFLDLYCFSKPWFLRCICPRSFYSCAH
ncbi:hypothetical protein Nepgr_017218 [Nepenthes gracilis]|uniref:Uncharacterized protein n=1 Tax=Nepenthes gracilis TaxID=150966 RepID=A0AAD3SS08_NEPGR|nr:hypothetical protein Nepgr_017218 [Nepenthes gracilis]